MTSITSTLSHHAYLVVEVISNLEEQIDLFSCCLVSRLWNTCATYTLWRAPRIKRATTFDKFIRTLCRTKQNGSTYAYGCLIHSLDLSRVSHHVGSAELDLISEICGVLKHIDFSNVGNVSTTLMCQIAYRCSDLRTLKLLNLPQLSDKAIDMIFSQCPRMEHFSIGDCGNVTDKGLTGIAHYGKNLTGLEIILGNKISCDTLSSITNSCTKLKRLHIWDCGNLDDSAILSISINLNDTLESLILNNPPALTDESLVQIAMRCRNLKHFGLEPHWGVTNSTLAVLAENANGLESLQLSLQYASRITNEGIFVLSRRLKNLKKIQIQESNTLHVNDLGLTFLITEQRINLTSLHIYNCNFSDLVLDTIVKTRPPINDVCFFQLPSISDYHFIRFLAAVSDTLNSLQLSYCDNITEFSVIEGLGVYGSGLRKLSICPSGEMTAEGLKAISTGCPNLKEFYLSSTEDLPTQVITLLLTSLRELEQLRIRDCPSIHPDDLRIIACGCPNLKEFYFGPSPYVDYAFIQEYNSNGKSRPLLVQGEG